VFAWTIGDNLTEDLSLFAAFGRAWGRQMSLYITNYFRARAVFGAEQRGVPSNNRTFLVQMIERAKQALPWDSKAVPVIEGRKLSPGFKNPSHFPRRMFFSPSSSAVQFLQDQVLDRTH